LALRVVTFTEQAPLKELVCAVASNVVVPPLVSVPENSSPTSLNKLQLLVELQVSVNVVDVVFGAMAPNSTVHEPIPFPLIVPSRVKVQPLAVNVAFVGVAPLLMHSAPITTASLAAAAEAVNVSVTPLPLAECCTNTCVCVMPAHPVALSSRTQLPFTTVLTRNDSSNLQFIVLPRRDHWIRAMRDRVVHLDRIRVCLE
jgi:hypothetical protein